MVASGTPCDVSATGSFSGHRVARMRRLSSASSASDAWYRNGRMEVSAAGWTTAAAAPMNGASSEGAGEGAAVRVGADVMVVAPVGAAGEAPARTPLAIASTANENSAGLLI